MQLDRKNRILLALLLGAYFGFTALLLNPFTFLAANAWIASTLVLLCSTLFLLLAGWLLKHSEDSFRRRMFVLTSILFAALIGGISAWIVYPTTFLNTLLYLSSFVISALLPIVIAVLWFIFDDLKTKITISGSDEAEPELPILKLTNDKGKVLLKVKMKDVICFEANDNYVVAYYLTPDKGLSKSMERVALKRICEIVEELHVDFQRVHKSFLVNPMFVRQVEGKSQAYRLRMEHMDKDIPVSRNYDISRFEH
jgi:hypothetical protein